MHASLSVCSLPVLKESPSHYIYIGIQEDDNVCGDLHAVRLSLPF